MLLHTFTFMLGVVSIQVKVQLSKFGCFLTQSETNYFANWKAYSSSQSESRIHLAYLVFALDPSVESNSI